jgi:two-component system response regulator MtrA
MSANVLIVEDESAIVDFLRDNLRQDEHRVAAAGTVRDAVRLLSGERFDVVLVDVGLPDGSGLDVVRAIRGGDAGDPAVGVIVLTARTEEQDRLRGFQRGADDYVAKPFGYPELLARIGALHDRLRRTTRRDVLTVGEIEIDVLARSVRVAGTPVPLPAKEFELLATLARDPERVIPKAELLERIWGYRNSHTTRTLDSHASRLRRRIETVRPGTKYIVNRWGVGYALRAAAA